MPGESLSFEILASDHASSSFRSVGRAAADASVKMDLAAASAKLWNDTTLKQGKAAATSEAAMRSHAKAAGLLADAENVLAGRATKTTKLMADQGRELENTGRSAENAAGGFSALAGGGGVGGGGMGALIGAGVALSPIIATVGVGLLGFGAAAYGVAAPILKAAQATGGLSANMAKLNPEQQKVAQGLLGLGQEFGAFQKQMAPEVFKVFNEGILLAGHLLHDVQPVAKAFGGALAKMLGQVDAEFQSGTWQNFFGFMAKTAGPDMKLLSSMFTDLLHNLPGLLIALQPIGVAVLHIGDAAAKAVGPLGTFLSNVDASAHKSNQAAKGLDAMTVAWTNRWIPGAKTVNRLLGNVQHSAQGLGTAAGGAAKGTADAGDAAAVAGPKFFSLNTAVRQLNTQMTKLVGNLLTLQGSELSWKQSLQAAQTQLKSNTAGLEGNSKNALANRQAILAASNAAISFAGQQLTLGKDIGGASRTVEAQIRFLQGLHDKSQFVRAELAALRHEEQLLAAQRLNQTIHVQGLGQWSVSQSLAPGAGHRRAAGGLIPGAGSGDTYPALLTPGEVVVPKPMVSAGAVDHLRGALPGFAAGGLVPSYSGSPAMGPWVKHDDAATIRLIDLAVVKATVAGMKAARSAATAAASGGGHAGPGGGAPSANAALAHRLYASQLSPASWAAWNAVAMMESGWNQFARNPSSGAYGIAQALPPTKYPFAGQAAGGSNPTAQITWMWNYMAGRYGGPLGAEAHENAFHWYGRGLNATFSRPTILGVGERGPEHVSVTPAGSANDGGAVLAVLSRIERLLQQAPERTGGALGNALHGVARSARYSGMYSAR